MYGFIESEFDPRDVEFTKEENIRSEELPNMYDYTKFANLKIKDQGNNPTCVPTSISTMLEAMDYNIKWNIDKIYEEISKLEKQMDLFHESNSKLYKNKKLLIDELGIDLRVRAEQLTLEDFANITDYIKNNFN